MSYWYCVTCIDVACLTGRVCYPAGAVYSRYGKAEVGSPLMEHSQEELADCEGLVVRVRGDGQVYCIVLTTGMCTLTGPRNTGCVCDSCSGMVVCWTSRLL